MATIKCPFYDVSIVFADEAGEPLPMFFPSPHLVTGGGSNRCALITSAHSPCVMEISGQQPRWSVCGRNPENNGSYQPPR